MSGLEPRLVPTSHQEHLQLSISFQLVKRKTSLMSETLFQLEEPDVAYAENYSAVEKNHILYLLITCLLKIKLKTHVFNYSYTSCYGTSAWIVYITSWSLLPVSFRLSFSRSNGNLRNVAKQTRTLQLGAVEKHNSCAVRNRWTFGGQLQQSFRNCYTIKLF